MTSFQSTSEVSQKGQLDYVVNCGHRSERLSDGADALLRAWYWSIDMHTPATVSMDGSVVARINALEGL